MKVPPLRHRLPDLSREGNIDEELWIIGRNPGQARARLDLVPLLVDGPLHLVGAGETVRAERIGRQGGEERRQVVEAVCNDMDDALLRLEPPRHLEETRPEHDGAVAFE